MHLIIAIFYAQIVGFSVTRKERLVDSVIRKMGSVDVTMDFMVIVVKKVSR